MSSNPKIDQAIAAALEPQPAPRVTVQVTLGNGRIVGLDTPVDLQPMELLAFIGFLTSGGLAAELAKASHPRPRILVPRGG